MKIEDISWGKIKLSDNSFDVELSQNRKISILRNRNEVLVSVKTGPDEAVNRFITGADNNLFIEPGLPDLPIILKPSQYISILPSKKLEAYVEVPIFFRIMFGTQNNKNLIYEYNPQLLSKSYFGSSESGEFAYFIESPLYCCIDEHDNPGSNIYCPLTISNRSSQNLEFEKMVLRVPYLSVYEHKNTLIASPVSITFRGQEQISQVTYKKTPPVSDGTPKLITAPRDTEDKNLIRRSFYFIKNLYTG